MGTGAIKRAVIGVSIFTSLMCLALIFILTHMPLDDVSTQPWFRYSSTFWLDKILQCAMYAVLVGLIGCALFPLNKDAAATIESISGFRTAILFALVCTIAVVDEVTQPWFGRNCEILDIVADVTGIIPGFCIFLLLNEVRHQLLNGEW